MGTTTVIILLVVGVILYMQARKRGETKQGRTLRYVATGLMLVALALAIYGAVDDAADADQTAPRGIDADTLDNA